MTIRKQIEPLLEDFKRANGKGSVSHANLALIRMVETLVNHIEQHTPVFSNFSVHKDYNHLAPVVPVQHNFTTIVGGGGGLPPLQPMVGVPTEWKFPQPQPIGNPPLQYTETQVAPVENLIRSAEILHNNNMVVGEDYKAIMEHLKNPPTETPVKERGKPGPKPKPDSELKYPRRIRIRKKKNG